MPENQLQAQLDREHPEAASNCFAVLYMAPWPRLEVTQGLPQAARGI